MIQPYPPGKPLDELEREYGIRDSIKLASNENAWGASPEAMKAIGKGLEGLHRYPDGSCFYLVRALAERLKLQPEEIVIGNGSNEVIEFLVKAFVREGDEVITSHPSFLMYQKFVQVRGGINHVVGLEDMRHNLAAILGRITKKTRLIFLDNPNNPTGTFLAPERFVEFIDQLPESVILVVDEAYVEYMHRDLRLPLDLIQPVDGRCGVVFLRTFSKAYGLSGLRVGYGLMAEEIANCLHKVRQPFNVNLLAQVAAVAALHDEAFYRQTLEKTAASLAFLQEEIGRLGCRCYPTETNFFLVDVGGNADTLYQALLCQGVIVRSMSAYGFSDFIRITAGTEPENLRLLEALKKSLDELGYV